VQTRGRFDVVLCHLMVVETPNVDLISKYMRRRKKRFSFYFSSSKALKKSRMNKKEGSVKDILVHTWRA